MISRGRNGRGKANRFRTGWFECQQALGIEAVPSCPAPDPGSDLQKKRVLQCESPMKKVVEGVNYGLVSFLFAKLVLGGSIPPKEVLRAMREVRGQDKVTRAYYWVV